MGSTSEYLQPNGDAIERPRSASGRAAGGRTLTGTVSRRATESSEPVGSDQRGSDQQGRAVLVGASGADEVALENSSWGGGAFTQTLVEELNRQPSASFDSVLTGVASAPLAKGGERQNPNMTIAGAEEEIPGGRNFGVYIANQDYAAISDLQGARNDAQALSAQLSARGYETLGLHFDKTAAEMQEIFDQPASGSQVQPGDSLVLHYSGHGMDEGLAGCDYQPAGRSAANEGGRNAASEPIGIFKNSAIQTVLGHATSRGVDVTLLSDACHSGRAADELRENHINQLSEATSGTAVAPLTELAREIHATDQWLRSELRRADAARQASDRESNQPAAHREQSQASEMARGDETARAVQRVRGGTTVEYADPWETEVYEALVARLAGFAQRFEQLVGRPMRSYVSLSIEQASSRAVHVIRAMTNETTSAVNQRRAQQSR